MTAIVLHGIVIPTWMVGRIDHIPWNPVLDDQNDADLGAITNDYENGEVFLIKFIQLKGVA